MSRPTTGELLLTQLGRLYAQVERRGHRLARPEQDTDVSLVVECKRCPEIFGVDGQERPYLFGNLNGSCAGSLPLIA